MSLNAESWSIGERKKLARLLSVYPLDAYENIAANLRKKSAEEVEHYLKKMIYSTKVQMMMNKDKRPSQAAETSKAPLETWLDVACSLVKNEQYDFSKCLSKVMAFIAHFEEFPQGEIEGHPQPNYKVIYKYLSQLLEDNKHEDIEELGPLECCVVVDLLHSLMEVFNECDLSVQFNVLRWKYFLLNERDSMGQPIPDLLRQASENDFGDFLKGKEETSNSAEKPTDRSSKEGQSGPEDQEKTTKEAKEKSSQPDTSVSVESGDKQYKVVAHYTYEASYSANNKRKTSDPRNHLNDLVYHNKPGRKLAGKGTTTVTEIVRVVPPKDAKIVQIQPRAKKPTIRDDGKYFGINCGYSVKKVIQADRQFFPDVSEPVILTDQLDANEVAQSQKRKYKSLMKKKDTKKEIKKPRLYSLNPFCLPISLLDIDS